MPVGCGRDRMRLRFFAVFCCLCPLSAYAQDSEWIYSANIYAWVPGRDALIDTPLDQLNRHLGRGSLLDDLDMAFMEGRRANRNHRMSNPLDNLDMALMGTFEARRNRWGILIDGLYAKLSTSKDSPFGLTYSEGDISIEMSALSAYALYRSYDGPRLITDIGLGLRAFDIDLDIKFTPGRGASRRSFGGDKSWVLPLVVGRFTVPIGKNWFSVASFDYGQTSGDEATWQGVATIGYHFNEHWAVQAGYRHMELEQDIGGLNADISLSGPILGMNIKF